MSTFIAFLIILFGCVNWMSIGMLQYDIVAGFFGTQSNILSRVIYIVIGFAALWFLVSTIRQKGKVNIFKSKLEKKPSERQEFVRVDNRIREDERYYEKPYDEYDRR